MTKRFKSSLSNTYARLIEKAMTELRKDAVEIVKNEPAIESCVSSMGVTCFYLYDTHLEGMGRFGQYADQASVRFPGDWGGFKPSTVALLHKFKESLEFVEDELNVSAAFDDIEKSELQ